MKGLIPAAGMGTRLQPITLAIPKELLMIGDKAVIEHVINAMKNIGVKEITIVVGWKKNAILDYLGSGDRLGVKLTYVVQDKRDGLGKAVLTGQHVIGENQFLVILGDNFFYPETFLKDILTFHKQNSADATIGVGKIKDPQRHGIIKPGENNQILNIIEKPTPENAPSNLGAIGIYVFKPSIFEMIEKTRPGYNNEIQLTDAIKLLIDNGKKVIYKELSGTHIDIGTLNDLKNANELIHQK
jgi:glucose-1-phosphate thymidylyltransferase long form